MTVDATDAPFVQGKAAEDTSGDATSDTAEECAAIEDTQHERACVKCGNSVACPRALCDRQVLFVCPTCSQREWASTPVQASH